MATRLDGWEIDLPALYGRRWKDREKFHLSESLWESPDGKYAAVLYAIAEVGISKEVGRLAVFRRADKSAPVLDLQKMEFWHLYQSAVQFGEDNVIFLHRFKSSLRRLHVEICAVDIGLKMLCPIRGLEEDFYKVRWTEGRKYGFKAMSREDADIETFIDLNDLIWHVIR